MSSIEQRRPTLQDVADAAGVSIATASYALNGRSDRKNPAPKATLAKVKNAAVALGYRANTSARVLRRRRTELIGIVYLSPGGPWLDRLTIQAEDIAAAHGYSVVGIPVRRAQHTELSLRVVERGYLDGVIFANLIPGTIDYPALSGSTRAAVIFGDDEYGDDVDVVRHDARHALAEATEYLIASGRRRIAYLTHDPAVIDLNPRYLGYADAFRQRGLAPDPSLVLAGAQNHDDALASLRDLFARPDRPDALISESDRGALATLQYAQQIGLHIPTDLAVIGVGNTREAELAVPALTSVGMPEFDFGAVIETLFARIEDSSLAPSTISMPWSLNLRESA